MIRLALVWLPLLWGVGCASADFAKVSLERSPDEWRLVPMSSQRYDTPLGRISIAHNPDRWAVLWEVNYHRLGGYTTEWRNVLYLEEFDDRLEPILPRPALLLASELPWGADLYPMEQGFLVAHSLRNGDPPLTCAVWSSVRKTLTEDASLCRFDLSSGAVKALVYDSGAVWVLALKNGLGIHRAARSAPGELVWPLTSPGEAAAMQAQQTSIQAADLRVDPSGAWAVWTQQVVDRSHPRPVYNHTVRCARCQRATKSCEVRTLPPVFEGSSNTPEVRFVDHPQGLQLLIMTERGVWQQQLNAEGQAVGAPEALAPADRQRFSMHCWGDHCLRATDSKTVSSSKLGR